MTDPILIEERVRAQVKEAIRIAIEEQARDVDRWMRSQPTPIVRPTILGMPLVLDKSMPPNEIWLVRHGVTLDARTLKIVSIVCTE